MQKLFAFGFDLFCTILYAHERGDSEKWKKIVRWKCGIAWDKPESVRLCKRATNDIPFHDYLN